jgi:hypothetical protein
MSKIMSLLASQCHLILRIGHIPFGSQKMVLCFQKPSYVTNKSQNYLCFIFSSDDSRPLAHVLPNLHNPHMQKLVKTD